MTALKFVRSVWESFRVNSGLEPRWVWTLYSDEGEIDPDRNFRLLDGFRVTAASPGKVRFELPIQKEHTNRLGILHGGTIASMVDLGGSLALASRGLFSTGLSTDLNVTYLNSGGKVGDLIRGEVVCDKFGKTLAFTSINFFNKDNEIVARGSHTKYVAAAQKDPQNIVNELKPEDASQRQY